MLIFDYTLALPLPPFTKKQFLMTTQFAENISSLPETKINDWFSEMIAALSADQLMMETNTAPERKREMYNVIINGTEADLHGFSRMSSSVFFIRRLIQSYLNNLNQRETNINKLAFDMSDAKILVWAEVSDDDDKSTSDLILAEAKVNAEFSKYGFHISTTVVEVCDNVEIPLHYKKFDLSKLTWHHSTII